MEARNQVQDTPAVQLYKTINKFIKRLAAILGEQKVDYFIKLMGELEHALYHEDDTPQTVVTIREVEEKQRIEDDLRQAKLGQVDATVQSRLEQLRLREMRNNLSDDVMERQRDKQSIAMEKLVVNNDIQLRAAIKTAEFEAEKEATGCCARLFCCLFPQRAKEIRKELTDLSARQKSTDKANQAANSQMDSLIDRLREERKKTDDEIAKEADKQRRLAVTSARDAEKRRLANISYFIKFDKDNDQHFLEDETMLMLLRFYERMLLFKNEIGFSSVALTVDEKTKLLSEAQALNTKNLKSIRLIDKYVDPSSGLLFKQLKRFFCKDRDEMTTTFDEFHLLYQAMLRGDKTIDPLASLDDPALLERLSRGEVVVSHSQLKSRH